MAMGVKKKGHISYQRLKKKMPTFFIVITHACQWIQQYDKSLPDNLSSNPEEITS
jgi:hypothetical protein